MSKIIENLQLENGSLANIKPEILKYVKDFYQQLFQKENIDQNLVDYF